MLITYTQAKTTKQHISRDYGIYLRDGHAVWCSMPIECDKRSLHARGDRLLATEIRHNALGEFFREAEVQVLAGTSTHR